MLKKEDNAKIKKLHIIQGTTLVINLCRDPNLTDDLPTEETIVFMAFSFLMVGSTPTNEQRFVADLT